MHILQREVIACGVCPNIAEGKRVVQLCHWLVVVLLSSVCQCAIESLLVVPLQSDCTLGTQCESLDGLPVE